MTRDAKIAAWLMLGVYLFSGLSPVGTSFDSRWTVFVAMNLLLHGTTHLDEYKEAILANDFYALECVSPSGAVRKYGPLACDGHFYNAYPIGGPVLTAPLIWIAVGAMRLAQPQLSRFHASHPVIEGFLQGDFQAAHPLIEMEVASLLLAVSAGIFYFIARRYLPEKRAILAALLFALGTSAYSVAGRGLWQHTPSMLLLLIVIWMLLRAEDHPSLAAWTGLPVALSYTVRPTDSLFVFVFTAYVALRHRKQLPGFLLAAAPVAVIFIAYNWSVYHQLLSPYYQSRLDGFAPRNWPLFGEALAGNLFSPARGLLVFTPVFGFSLWSIARGLWRTPLTPWLATLVLAHYIAVSSYVAMWWAGQCYGPRFFTDVTPVLALFLIPFFARWEKFSKTVRVAFVACALIGLGMHLRGGWSTAVYDWSAKPNNSDQHPERMWDWHDPPFLR
jgi:hypothetical protein